MAKRKQNQPEDYASGNAGGVALMDPPSELEVAGALTPVAVDASGETKPVDELPYEVEGQGETEAAKGEALPTQEQAEEQARKLEAIAEMEVYRREMLVSICAKETEVEIARNDWELKKERAGDAKKVFDGLVEQLLELIRKVKNPPSMPLFDGVPEPNRASSETDVTCTEPQAWRSVPLSEALVGLPEAIVTSLNESNLQTMGELADWTAAYGGRNKLTDIVGIGPAKAEKIEQTLVDFWARQKAVQDEPRSDDSEAASGPEPTPESEGCEPD